MTINWYVKKPRHLMGGTFSSEKPEFGLSSYTDGKNEK
jgi:hypothetical protein